MLFCLRSESPVCGEQADGSNIQCMQKLDKRVNIIPLIGKADACTQEELAGFKERIREQLEENDISVYKFPDEEEVSGGSSLKGPFAVVGSNVILEDPLTGKPFRGRKYPWGCVSIEDEVRLANDHHLLLQCFSRNMVCSLLPENRITVI